MKVLQKSLFSMSSLLVILSCSPAFETTAEKCQSNQSNSVDAEYLSFKLDVDADGNIIRAVLNEDGSPKLDENDDPVTEVISEYRLYLQDILTATKATGDISEDNSAALAAMIDKFNTQLSYTINDEQVITSADNPIDFIEYLIASTDNDVIIQDFVDAKKQLADGIESDDGFCTYTNKNIRLKKTEVRVDEDGNPVLNGEEKIIDVLEDIFAELRMTYDPFNEFFNQNIILTNFEDDLDSATARSQTPFVGFYESVPADFKAKGFSPPTVRFTSMNSSDLTETYSIDDSFIDNTTEDGGGITKLGQMEFNTFDSTCYLTEVDDKGDEVFVRDDDNSLILKVCDEAMFNKFCYINELDENDETQQVTVNCDEDISAKLCYVNELVDTGTVDDNNDPVLATTQVAVGCEINLAARVPQKSQCASDFDSNGEAQTNETGSRIMRSINLVDGNDTLENIQRFRLETDYISGEVRIYVSQYTEAIENLYITEDALDDEGNKVIDDDGKIVQRVVDNPVPDAEKVIFNPTNCEKQAILDELAEIADLDENSEGVRLTSIADSGYDIVYALDDNGNIVTDENGSSVIAADGEPSPIFSFEGTIIPERQ